VPDTEVEDLLRRLAPRVLGAVVRRYGHFDTAEDDAIRRYFAGRYRRAVVSRNRRADHRIAVTPRIWQRGPASGAPAACG